MHTLKKQIAEFEFAQQAVHAANQLKPGDALVLGGDIIRGVTESVVDGVQMCARWQLRTEKEKLITQMTRALGELEVL